MRKGRYSSSGDTPLDKDVDTALKQEVERISRERNGASGENGQTPEVPQRSPELQAYYTGSRPRRPGRTVISKVDAETAEGLDLETEESFDLETEESFDREDVLEDKKYRKSEEKRKKTKRQEIFSIIGYAVYHFVCMGLIALCVILIYFCIKFIDVSDNKKGQTVYHYHEGESESQSIGE